jgi:hypothetical protein
LRVPGIRETKISHGAQKIMDLVDTPAVTAAHREASSTAEPFGQLANDVARIDRAVPFSGVFKSRDQEAGELTNRSSAILARIRDWPQTHLSIVFGRVISSAALDLLGRSSNRWDIHVKPVSPLVVGCPIFVGAINPEASKNDVEGSFGFAAKPSGVRRKISV